MELKKGDVVAVVAEVVAERDGKIIISIPGATVSEDLIIAPRKPIRVLERSASPGDSVMYKDEIPCIYRRNETQNVVSLVREGMPHDDPTSYLFANIKDIRRIDQDGTVKFVSTERHFPNAETGREAMDRMKSEEDVEAMQQDDQADDESTASTAPEVLEAPIAREEELEAQAPITETASPLPVLLPPETEKAPNIEANAPDTEPDLEIEADDADDADDAESDKITIEMPEGFPPRRPVVEEAVQAPPAPAADEKAVEQSPTEEISSEESVNAAEDASPEEQERPTGDSDEKEDEVAPETESEAMAAPVIEDGPDETVTEESEAAASEPELTDEEIEEKNRRVNKLRQETITNLNGDEGDSSEAPKPASIFDDIDDLDGN